MLMPNSHTVGIRFKHKKIRLFVSGEQRYDAEQTYRYRLCCRLDISDVWTVLIK